MDPLFSHETLLSPEKLFGAVVAWRQKKPPIGAEHAFEALDAMREVNPQLEYNNRRLFMSSIAEDMNILASGVVEYNGDPELANVTPIRKLSPAEIETDRAHNAYVNAVTEIDNTEPEDIGDNLRVLNARQNLEAVFGRKAA